MGADRGLHRAQAKTPGAPLGLGVLLRSRQLYSSASAGLHPETRVGGAYPHCHGRIREPVSEGALDALARFLARQIAVTFGQTSARGLTKLEPTDMERLLVPDLLALNERESPTER